MILLEYHVRAPFIGHETDARKSYYRVSGTPHVMFNGQYKAIGINSGLTPYERYRRRVELVREDPTPLEVEVGSVMTLRGESARIEVSIEATDPEALFAYENCHVRVAVYEDNVREGNGVFHRLVRGVYIDDEFSLDDGGISQDFAGSVPLGVTWKTEDLYVVAWVQDDDTKNVLDVVRARLGDPVPVIEKSWGGVKRSFLE